MKTFDLLHREKTVQIENYLYTNSFTGSILLVAFRNVGHRPEALEVSRDTYPWTLLYRTYKGKPMSFGFLDPVPKCMRVGVPTQANNSPTPPGCPATQFTSILTLSTQGEHEIPLVKGSAPQDRPPLQTLITSLGCYLYFWLTGYKSEVPIIPSLSSINLVDWLTELGKLIYSLDYQVITKNIKGYRWTARWRYTYDKVPNKGVLSSWSLWSLGLSTLACGSILIPQPRSSSFWIVKMEASLHRHDWLTHWPLGIDSTSRPSPFSRNQEVELKVPKLSSHGRLPWQPAPILWWLLKVTFINRDPVALERGFLEINHKTPISPLWALKCFQELKTRDQLLQWKILLLFLQLRKFQGIWELRVRNYGCRPNIWEIYFGHLNDQYSHIILWFIMIS